MEQILDVLQVSQQWGIDYGYEPMLEGGYAIFDGDEILGIGGLFGLDSCRGMCWSLLSGNIGARFFKLHKIIKHGIENSTYQRLEMAVAENHVEANRWAHMLKFKPEGLMKKYFPDGGNAILWARTE